MSLQNRIEVLEKRRNKGKEPNWILLYPAATRPSGADIEAAKAAYKAKHPRWRLELSIMLPVGYSNRHDQDNIERLIHGERT
jgi:hypothetical protein